MQVMLKQQLFLSTLIHDAFLFNEAVDKRAENKGQDDTAAEDHHLFLEDRMRKDTQTEKRKKERIYHSLFESSLSVRVMITVFVWDLILGL